MKDDESKERWGQYFNMLMNKENQRVETEERYPNQAMIHGTSVRKKHIQRDEMWESSRSRRNTS